MECRLPTSRLLLRAGSALAASALLVVACARTLPAPREPAPEPPPEAVERAAEAPREEPEMVEALVAAPAPPSAPAAVRVGLATDLPAVVVPCCEMEVRAVAGAETVGVTTALRVEPAATARTDLVYRVQVAALRDEGQARSLAASLAQRTGEPAEARFDAAAGLYRVRVGRHPRREEAERASRRLATLGLGETWVVSEGRGLERPALTVRQGDAERTVQGRWLRIEATSGEGIRVQGRRYRGDILVFLNERGLLNLINELALEDYLRGVVPREMGPALYDEVEALKAQTVAARTYTVRHLGEFEADGFDLCATPRCQAYGGMDAEHPLSDRAVRETAGEVVLFRGELANALYSSTCGGHTEDVEVVFPLQSGEYLRGVPCLEAGVEHLEGAVAAGGGFPELMTRQLLPPGAGLPAAVLEERLRRLARLAGLPAGRDSLASLDRREVYRFIVSLLDLLLDVHLFVAPQDLPYLIEAPPPRWGEEDLRLAAFFAKSGLAAAPVAADLEATEIEELLLRLAEFLRVVERREARFLSLDGEVLTVRRGEEVEMVSVPAGLATYRRYGEALRGESLALVPGDALTLFWHGERLLGVVQEVHPQGAAFDRTSRRSSWSRFRSDREIAQAVRERYPGLEFAGLEVLSRGVSGRVGQMRIHGRNAEAVDVEGLAVRWTLDLPDTWFTARRLSPSNGEPGWHFAGRGWGHGVGMCQVGAFGMAVRGHDYRTILRHYYTGIEIGRLRVAAGGRR